MMIFLGSLLLSTFLGRFYCGYMCPINTVMEVIDEDAKFTYDSVKEPIATAQQALDFLGYDIDRTDGYFDKTFENSLKAYQSDNNLKADGILTKDLYEMMLSRTIREWNENAKDYDTQLDEALVIING